MKAVKRANTKQGDTRKIVIAQLAEVFRAHGYEGTSLSLITQATGLGKGSLYNLFPRGKEQMAEEVLAHIDDWFERNVFAPLRDDKSGEGLAHMFEATDRYFESGGRVCLVGVFALGGARDLFGQKLRGYFKSWEAALAAALRRQGMAPSRAKDRAEEIVLGIQGALVLARAQASTSVFSRALKRLRAGLD
ncbi:TetR/AcrR family transcriptional regulator [Pseudorhodoplanes sinuspersici]|uniref:TetR family transcriptional regulator n=1 Tax=Pseudorhodoplanes sinuspersici TaxID=1235591 RepID=A0A1W6ZLT4_9HYPH|nr:TetR/AcrR family transcriptional regulator [Pseudorhodoplanes sinuspersici]ARP98346.1 TetR family transcriptional regulator [Pseudorhodoplanes sinuspersici]RKE66005.1 TetR family transcriptional regulator [Pseudorhodoplanes sinuspersici]